MATEGPTRGPSTMTAQPTAQIQLMFRRRPVPDMRPDHDAIMERVDLHSEINLVTGCWEWEGHRNQLGYGEVSWRNRVWMVTRLVYAATRGAFDPQLDICHSCDNPGCVNPEHFRADTHKANLLDASKKKRLNGQWKTHCKRGHPLAGDNLRPWGPWRQCKTCDTLRKRGQLQRS